ncbi:MAG: hypothetical protein NVSMB6_17780 [Burkholderiaceae bacterium]
MSMTTKRGADRGFTLIELLIVVIILAILAAIVIPQFSNSTTDAKEATLDSNLSAIRSAVELYRAQHNGTYPGFNASSGSASCAAPGVAGTGAAGSAGSTPANSQAFVDQMTQASTVAGATCTLADTLNNKYGPYIRGALPADPITNSTAITISSNGAPAAPTVTTGGYLYDIVSGKLMINSSALDSKGRAYYTH